MDLLPPLRDTCTYAGNPSPLPHLGMVETFLRAVTEWAAEEPGIVAVGLVGSYARGAPKVGSDVDLILVVANPGLFFANTDWINRFGDVRLFRDEDWRRCRSMRVYYVRGLEVEFGFVSVDWAKINPVDPGTKQVVAGGLQLLYDPEMLLKRLATFVAS
jgi:uncharacterized protein